MQQTQSFMKSAPPKAVIRPVEKVKNDVNQIKDLIGVNDEQIKYLKAWNLDEYRNWSPGEQCVPLFIETAKPTEGTFVDWGCGTGRAGHKVWKETDLDVTLVDFAINCLDEQVKEDLGDKFVEHDLSKPIDLKSDYGMCCDVLEHVPEDQVDDVINTILDNSRHTLFQIATVPDHFGKHEAINAPLHVTVKPYQWWLRKFVDHGVIVHHSNEFDQHVIFYVTGWGTFRFNNLAINTKTDVVIENMRENAKLGLPEVSPHEAQEDLEIMLLCGGPSLNDYEDEIRELREGGMPLVTSNGTYHWCLERDIKPSMQMVIDAREFNKRFVEPVVDDCKYIVATQCHPNLVKSLPQDRSMLWHVSLDDDFLPVIKELHGEMYKDWWPVAGGSTVTLRGLCALQMLGFRKIHVYGFDSCLREDAHHAYEQKENNATRSVEMIVGRGTEYEKEFQCQPWMAFQAKEFQDMATRLFANLQLDIKGDGLISYLVETGAALAEQ